MNDPTLGRLFARWLRKLWKSVGKQPPQFTSRRVERCPPVPEPNIVYVIGDDECSWGAALVCPCGCRAIIQLSLATDASPSWSVKDYRDGTFSLVPSVWRTKGCRSHFIIHRSRLLWCDSDR
jgi:hypothetical protein